MSCQRGAILLEALVSLTILSLVGGAVIGVLSAAQAAERRAVEIEQTLDAADRVMTAMSLLSRRDLDLRLGSRRVGEFTVTVLRPERTLYRIGITEARVLEVELLATVVYRPVTFGR